MTSFAPLSSKSLLDRNWPSWVAPVLVAAVAALLFFTNLGSAGLWDEDEPRNGGCAREMIARGDWIVPYFNGELRTQKPVLLYWMQMVSYNIFGINEFAARFPSALLSVGTCLMAYWMGRMLVSARVGMMAGLILSSSLMFDVAARASTPDGALIFGVMLTMTMFVRACSTSEEGSFGRVSVIPQRWSGMALVYAAMGWSMLAKGPVGVILPSAIIGLFILLAITAKRSANPSLVQRAANPSPQNTTAIELPRNVRSNNPYNAPQVVDPNAIGLMSEPVAIDHESSNWFVRLCVRLFAMLKKFMPVTWALRPLTGAVSILAIAAPWYIAVGVRTNWVWPKTFFFYENLQRANQAMENHRGPIIYYLPAIMIGFFPWSIFLILSIVRASVAVARSAYSPAQRFLLCWIAVWIGAFSMAATKLPSYVLPVYPALAILVAMMLDQWLKRPEIVKTWMFRVAWSVLGIVGIGFSIGLPIAAQKIQLPEESILGLMGVIPMVGAVAAAVWHAHHQQKRVIAAMCATAICFSLAFFGWGAVRVSKHQNSPSLIAMIEQSLDDRGAESARIGTFYHPASSLTFYAGKPVKPCADVAAVNELLKESTAANPVFIVSSESKYKESLKGNLPADVVILHRENRFLKNEKIIVLGRVSRMAKRDVENKNR